MTDVEQPSSDALSDTSRKNASEQLYTKDTSIRTYQDDIADTIRERNMSVASIALAQKKREWQGQALARKQQAEAEHPEHPARKFFLIGGGVLIIILLGVFGWWYARNAPSFAPSSSRPAFHIVQADSEEIIEKQALQQTALPQTLRNLLTTETVPLGTLHQLTITQKVMVTVDEKEEEQIAVISSNDLFDLLSARAPGRVRRALNPDFVLGLFGGAKPSTVLLFTTDDYETAFAGMLEWEPIMHSDFAFLFTKDTRREIRVPVPVATTATTSTSTDTTQASSSVPTTPSTIATTTYTTTYEEKVLSFKDIVVQNKDVRALVDDEGTPYLMYSFPNRNTLIIATERDALTDMFKRLNQVQFTN